MRRKPRELPEDSTTEVEWRAPKAEQLNAKGAGDPLPVPVGFGCQTTGGAHGEVLHVRKPDDPADELVEGTLRWALAQTGPTWVVFEKDLTIELHAPLAPTADTTIDGRGHAVTIAGHTTTGGFRVEADNVVVESLTLAGFGDHDAAGNTNNPHDAIYLRGCSRIWVDHCDLSAASDKALAISFGCRDVTVSACHFHDQKQTFQIGNMTNAMLDVEQTVTSLRNYFDACGYRLPVVSYGKLHQLNCYLRAWGEYGVRSQRIAQAYVEGNVFEAGEDPSATLIHPANDGANDSGSLQDDRDGYLYDVANLYINKCKKQSTGPDHVFNPKDAYAYTADEATPDLAQRVAADAGPL